MGGNLTTTRLAMGVGLPLLLAMTACRPGSSVPLEQLLLSVDELPGDWVAAPQGPYNPSGQAPLGGGLGRSEATKLAFYHPVNGGTASASEEIMLFRTLAEAEDAYSRTSAVTFSDNPHRQWVRPMDDGPLPQGASEWELRCTEGRSDQICILVARYGRYLVVLTVHTVAFSSKLEPVRVLTEADLASVVQSADERMMPVIGMDQ